jgi:hypothetical protein
MASPMLAVRATLTAVMRGLVPLAVMARLVLSLKLAMTVTLMLVAAVMLIAPVPVQALPAAMEITAQN